MRKQIVSLCMALLSCGFMWPGLLCAEVNPKPFVVPELTQWQGAEGSVALSGRVVVKSSQLQAVAQALAHDYETMMGRKLTVVKGSAKPGDVVLALNKNKALGTEGYTLRIGRTVSIEAATPQGVYWGTRTLLQISEQSADRTLPCGVTTDVPQYGLRGFMIDCGRKYIPMAYLRQLTKVMAYYKMNTLQVHLNDNGFRQYFNGDWNLTQAAFRLECDTYPGLTAKDGSYTKQEFIDFQKAAEAQFVEVIPEIDAPAHALAFTQYKPELGSKEYGMDHLDLFNPETYTFMDNLYKEYLQGKEPVFRGPRVHIGTDEYSNAKKDVVEKFRAFTDHYIRYVESFGKQAVVWGALTHAQGETKVKSDNVWMSCWYNGFANPKDMKEQGYKLISIPDGLVYIVPAAGYYYDYLNCQYLYEHYTPATIGNQQFEENDPAILGGMFAVWNDHAGNGISVKDIHHRTFPALQTLAAKCWSGKLTSVPYAEFDAKRVLLSEAPGVNELGRLGKAGQLVLQVPTLQPEATTGVTEIGYDYSVSFTIDGADEARGTVLLQSPNATFYLSDPRRGRLGFERDGYLNTFNYTVEKGKQVTLTIEGNNRMTRLLVNGQVKEELGAQTLYVMKPTDVADYQVGAAAQYKPVVYNPSDRIYYQRTLVFPLQQAGKFNSRITNLEVKVVK